MVSNYFLLLSIILGIIPAIIAKRKGRRFIGWWIYGSLIILVALPHAIVIASDPVIIEKRLRARGMKKCPYCAEMIKGEAKVCRYCGNDVELS